jgi:flagellar biogenesis protein FliO
MELIVTLVKIAAVFGLLFVTLRFLTRTRGLRFDGGRNGRAPQLEVTDKARVGRTSSIVTVRIGERTLLLGVTETQISTLADVSDDLANLDLFTDAADAGADPARTGDAIERISVMDHAIDLIRSGGFARKGH